MIFGETNSLCRLLVLHFVPHGDLGCFGLERQRFEKKAMKLWFRTLAETVIKLLALRLGCGIT
jgi:hypothetical protein